MNIIACSMLVSGEIVMPKGDHSPSSDMSDVVVVPTLVGLRVRDALEVAEWAGVGLAQPDADGPALVVLA